MNLSDKKLSKSEIQEKIKFILSSNPSPEQIKKIKKLAMSKNIRLSDLRKSFCKKCLTFFNSTNSEVRIKSPYKIVKCKSCRHISRWKMK
jgi:RNase P subunit RPR2